MNTKCHQLAFVVIALNSCLWCRAQMDEHIVQTNSHWHIVSGPPSGILIKLTPTNVPIQFVPLKDGKWAWSTNVEEWWRGIWKEDTNGWRTQLSGGSHLTVYVGSTVRDSDGCFIAPNGKFGKFELSDTNGTILQPKDDAGTNLLSFISNDLFYPTNLPAWAAPSPGTLVADFPQTTSTNVFPRYYRNGDIACLISFSSDGPPHQIACLNLNCAYSITNEGDYTLTVQPVLYSRHIAHITLSRERLKELLKQGVYMAYYEKNGLIYAETNLNSNILYRRDLPCVTTTVHLVPNVK